MQGSDRFVRWDMLAIIPSLKVALERVRGHAAPARLIGVSSYSRYCFGIVWVGDLVQHAACLNSCKHGHFPISCEPAEAFAAHIIMHQKETLAACPKLITIHHLSALIAK